MYKINISSEIKNPCPGMAYRPLRYKDTKLPAISIQPPDSVISYCPKQQLILSNHTDCHIYTKAQKSRKTPFHGLKHTCPALSLIRCRRTKNSLIPASTISLPTIQRGTLATRKRHFGHLKREFIIVITHFRNGHTQKKDGINIERKPSYHYLCHASKTKRT